MGKFRSETARPASLTDAVFDLRSDEILNGKTHDTNSNFFAKYCFEHGIDLYATVPTHCCLTDILKCRKRIEVIPDEEEEMYVRRFAWERKC